MNALEASQDPSKITTGASLSPDQLFFNEQRIANKKRHSPPNVAAASIVDDADVMGEEMGPNKMGENPMPSQAPQYTGADKDKSGGGGALRRAMGLNLMAAGQGFAQGMMGQRVGRAFSQGQGGLKDLMSQRRDQVGLQEDLAQGAGAEPGTLESIQAQINRWRGQQNRKV